MDDLWWRSMLEPASPRRPVRITAPKPSPIEQVLAQMSLGVDSGAQDVPSGGRRLAAALLGGLNDAVIEPARQVARGDILSAMGPPALRAEALIGERAIPEVAEIAKGMFRNKPMTRIKAVDVPSAQRMARVFESLPKHDKAAENAYRALAAEVEAQANAIRNAGYDFQFVDADPYTSSLEMMADVAKNKRLKVYKTAPDQAHPFMTPAENDAFRGVHGWVAHAGGGNQFGPIGEENAFRLHAATLSPEAQRALATETRGQNSWVNYGPNAHLPVAQRPFAEQKAALWPKEFLGEYGTFPRPSLMESIDEMRALGRENPLDPRSRFVQTPNGLVMFEVGKGVDGDAVLNFIRSTERGKGHASDVLKRLLEIADRNGTTMSLFPKRVGNDGLSSSALSQWYKRHGFAGRSHDYLVRPPKK